MPKHKVLSEFNIVKGPRYKRNSKKFQVGKTNAGPTQRKKKTNSKNENYKTY